MDDYDDYYGNETFICGNETLDQTHIYHWDELLPQLVVYAFTFVFGVSGNTLMMYTILRFRRMKSITNAFLASLAIADLLLIFICIPVKVRYLHRHTSLHLVYLATLS